jgi:hypothetical protein
LGKRIENEFRAIHAGSCTATFTVTVGTGSGIVEVLTWYAAHLPGGPSVTSNTVGFSVPVNNKGKAVLTA